MNVHEKTGEPVYAEDDVMRQTALRSLTKEELENIGVIKMAGQRFIDIASAMGNSREVSLAKTKMEEAVMWAVKHITA